MASIMLFQQKERYYREAEARILDLTEGEKRMGFLDPEVYRKTSFYPRLDGFDNAKAEMLRQSFDHLEGWGLSSEPTLFSEYLDRPTQIIAPILVSLSFLKEGYAGPYSAVSIKAPTEHPENMPYVVFGHEFGVDHSGGTVEQSQWFELEGKRLPLIIPWNASACFMEERQYEDLLKILENFQPKPDKNS